MGATRFSLAVASLIVIVGASPVEAREDLCKRNHYILDVECPIELSFGTGGLAYLGPPNKSYYGGDPIGLIEDRASPSFIGYDDPMFVRSLEDGAILVGTRRTLTRVTARGAVDTSFGYGQRSTSGRCVTPARCNGVFGPFIVLDDGSILVSLVASTSWEYAGPGVFGLVKLDANGKRDRSFGVDGIALLAQTEGLDDIHAVGLMRQADGSIVVVGSTLVRSTWQYRWSMARFAPNGVPDQAFSAGGRRLLDRGNDALPAFAEGAGGRFYLAGNDGTRQSAPWIRQFPHSVTRFTATGEWDSSFAPYQIPGQKLFQEHEYGSDVLVQFTVSPPRPAMAEDQDGSLLVVANELGQGFGGHTAWANAARVGPDGTGSVVARDFDASNDVLIDHDGFIVLSGGSVVTRRHASGALDRSFGLLGTRTLPKSMHALAIHVTKSGRVLVAGTVWSSAFDPISRRNYLERQPVLGLLRPADGRLIGLVAEFKQKANSYYFYTAFEEEIAGLKNAEARGDGVWERTGGTFPAWSEPAPGLLPVCRFASGPAQRPQFAHFFTADPLLCETIKPPNDTWTFEGVAFYIQKPNTKGVCPANTQPLRGARNGISGVPNVRLFVPDSIESTWTRTLPEGWSHEGTAGVVGCLPQ